MDVAFSGEVNGCEGIACEIMARELEWREREDPGPRGAGKYNYVRDIDGHGQSYRCTYFAASALRFNRP